jgi:outer membrane lipoprotein LolB
VELTGRLNVVYQKDGKPNRHRQFQLAADGQHRRHLISPTGRPWRHQRHAARGRLTKRQAPRSATSIPERNAGLDLAGVGPARLAARLCHERDGKRFVASPANDNVTPRWLALALCVARCDRATPAPCPNRGVSMRACQRAGRCRSLRMLDPIRTVKCTMT